ncbi:MAG: hypothetical protein KA963_01015, partial [Candidatus Cloacimonas sp.]|nr:hypothetical protein [Candidatus Cloacimonas sp.]
MSSSFIGNTGVSLPQFFPEKRCPHRLVLTQLFLGADKAKREKKRNRACIFRGVFCTGARCSAE